jgi:SAM-dependent methyltransferase
MALVGLERIERLLVCPRCRTPLSAARDVFSCRSPRCPHHTSAGFPVIGGWPVLVDFERSVLRREDLADTAGRTRQNPLGRVSRLPRPLRRLWKPSNRVAARNIEALMRALPGSAPTLLVVGGGTVGNGVDAVYRDPRVQVIAFDLVGSPVTQFIADAHHIPLPTASVDGVLVQAVLEHVLDPALVVAEVHRVLKSDGIVYAETPFLQQVHAGPYDFTRFTASGHRYLFRGFEELAAGPVAGPGTQLLWSVDHLVRGLTRSAFAGRVTRLLLCWLRTLDRLVPAQYAMDDATAYYFLGRRRESEMSPPEIVAYYAGAQTKT